MCKPISKEMPLSLNSSQLAKFKKKKIRLYNVKLYIQHKVWCYLLKSISMTAEHGWPVIINKLFVICYSYKACL